MSISHNSLDSLYFDFEFEDESKDQKQPELDGTDNLDYCSFCASIPFKMIDHEKAHSLRIQDKFV